MAILGIRKSPMLTLKTLEHACKCAAEQGIAEEEALKQGMEAKSKEFQESGAELYAKA